MEEFLETIEDENLRELILFLDRFIMSYDEKITRTMRFKVPFYDYNNWFCYLNPVQKYSKVEWVFMQGKEMEDLAGVLQGKGRKLVKGITMSPDEDLDVELLKNLLADAIVIQKRKTSS